MKWLHTLASIGLLAAGALAPSMQVLVMGHPAVAMGLTAAWGVLGQILPHGDPTSGLPQSKAIDAVGGMQAMPAVAQQAASKKV